ncbi:MAG: response regulator [Burkholderiales bacterium]|nr:response regulator [Anaerolineae bacterium]
MTNEAALKSGRVLLLEDNLSLLRLYSKTLAKADYTVHEAMTVAEAEQLLKSNEFDIFICDMRIGGAHSADLLREWAAPLKEKGTTIIAMSAYEQYRRTCAEMGIENFMPKPITPSNLIDVLNTLSA